jgi:hypothetical protein
MHVEEFSNSKIQQNYTVNFYLEAVHAGSMMQHKNVYNDFKVKQDRDEENYWAYIIIIFLISIYS